MCIQLARYFSATRWISVSGLCHWMNFHKHEQEALQLKNQYLLSLSDGIMLGDLSNSTEYYIPCYWDTFFFFFLEIAQLAWDYNFPHLIFWPEQYTFAKCPVFSHHLHILFVARCFHIWNICMYCMFRVCFIFSWLPVLLELYFCYLFGSIFIISLAIWMTPSTFWCYRIYGFSKSQCEHFI